jgi:hypothetical protein
MLKSLVLGVSLLPFVLGAQNLVKNGDAEAGMGGWDAVQVVTDNPHSGKSCFKTVATNAVNSEIIPVDASKKYKLAGWVKSADDKSTLVILGLMPLDANKIPIECCQVNVVPDTETELAEACKAEDTIIKVKDASKWKLCQLDTIAFDVDNSGEYKDLPNRNTSAGIVAKSENKNNVWELTLNKPCGKAYPAGTKVRDHRYGGTYTYPIVVSNFNSKEWKDISSEISGVSKFGRPDNQFWAGTKFVKVIVLSLSGGMIYFDDIKFEEQK